jgi:hypothetical protein
MQRLLRRDGMGWDGGGIGTIPLAFRTFRSAGTSRSLPGRRELIWEKRLAMREKIATRYMKRQMQDERALRRRRLLLGGKG